jgi:DNA-binding transcriptional regulator YiaG
MCQTSCCDSEIKRSISYEARFPPDSPHLPSNESVFGTAEGRHHSCSSHRPEFIPALPFCHALLKASKPQPSHYPKLVNTLGDHIRSHRLDLGFFQSNIADQIRVDTTTIHNWEGNKSVPAIRYIPAILQFLGYNPFPPAQTLPERLATVRKILGLSQRKMAELLGVDPGTLQGWEAGQHRPMGKNAPLMETFLRKFAGNPKN